MNSRQPVDEHVEANIPFNKIKVNKISLQPRSRPTLGITRRPERLRLMTFVVSAVGCMPLLDGAISCDAELAAILALNQERRYQSQYSSRQSRSSRHSRTSWRGTPPSTEH